MDTKLNSGKASLLTLPIELVREIGMQLSSPFRLLEFSLICKRVNSALSVTDFATKDIERIKLIWEYSLGIDRHGEAEIIWEHPLTIDRYGETEKARVLSLLSVWPLLIKEIESGRDDEYVKEYIRVYRESCPLYLLGKWGPYPASIPMYDRPFENCPTPMYAAALCGRLHIVQTLLELGVKFREPNPYPTSPLSDGDVFKAACGAGQDDIACFMISSGLPLVQDDLWHVVSNGCFKAFSLLLDQPLFRGDESNRLKLRALQDAAREGIKDNGILLLLIDEVLKFSSKKRGALVLECVVKALQASRDREFPWSGDRFPQSFRKAMYLLGILERSESGPIEADDILREAAKYDIYEDIIKLVLSGNRYTVGKSEDERSQVMQEALSIAIRLCAHKNIECLIQHGCKCSTVHFYQAIQTNDAKVVRQIVDSGVPVNSSFDFECESLDLKVKIEYNDQPEIRGRKVLRTPLQVALHSNLTRAPFYSVYQLIYLGVDYTNLPEEGKYWLYGYLARIEIDEYLTKRRTMERTNSPRLIEQPSRQTFSHLNTWNYSQYEPEEMIHAMARLILGDDYQDKLSSCAGVLRSHFDIEVDGSYTAGRTLYNFICPPDSTHKIKKSMGL